MGSITPNSNIVSISAFRDAISLSITATVREVLDQDGGFDGVRGWSAQVSEETQKGTDPEGGATQLFWTHLLVVLALSCSVLVVHPPDLIPLHESSSNVSGLLDGSFHSFSRLKW